MKFLIAFFILLKSVIFRKNLYTIHFIKVKGLWYCDIPHWPKAFFDNAQMVAGAARLLESLSKGNDEITLEVGFNKEHLPLPVNRYNRAHKTASALTNGAFYDVMAYDFQSSIWICPVTLFVVGKYPEWIFFRTTETKKHV